VPAIGTNIRVHIPDGCVTAVGTHGITILEVFCAALAAFAVVLVRSGIGGYEAAICCEAVAATGAGNGVGFVAIGCIGKGAVSARYYLRWRYRS